VLFRDRAPRPCWRNPVALSVAAATLLASIGTASAHPHVWVAAKSDIVFDDARRLVGIKQSWTFDEAYSAYMTINLDSNHDGTPDPDKLAELAQTNLKSIAEFGYFTHVKANGKAVGFGAPAEPRLTFANGRLTLDFTLPLEPPMASPKVMVLTVDDPSFFVAFSFAPGPDPVRFAGPNTGCAMNVNRAAQVAEEGKQIVPDEVAAANAPAVAGDYTSRVLVACP
jgi:ABC-type uncharacterized transport system substrate-binding protein